MAHQIAVIPGDGIGTEVVDASLSLVESASEKYGFSIETMRFDWGSERYHDEGAMMFDHLGERDAAETHRPPTSPKRSKNG